MRLWLFSASVALVLSGCSAVSSDSCVTSKQMTDGTSQDVEVLVATKPGLNANIVGTFDIDGGLYTTPVKDLGPETDVPVGTYRGVVTKSKGRLVLDYEGESVPLVGPQSCD